MNKIGTAFGLFFMVFVLSYCKKEVAETSHQTSQISSGQYEKGLKLVQNNCSSCHTPNPKKNLQIAPSLAEIKEPYDEHSDSESEFIEKMASFLAAPSQSNALMPEAVKRYGVMPNLGYTRKEYEAVAHYLYQSQISEERWYEEEYKAEIAALDQNETDTEDDYLQKGKDLALATKSILGKNLLFALSNQSTEEALSFCNERAIHLTDSMATALNAKIKRVSDQNRNPDNAASAAELAYIRQAKTQLESKGEVQAMMTEDASSVTAYYPIITNEMCLKCHGSDLEDAVAQKIKKLYPEDQAVGYDVNELRGIWVVEMAK